MITADNVVRVKHVCLIAWPILPWPANITLSDLFVLRDIAREARAATEHPLVLVIALPKGLHFETPVVGKMFAERIAVLVAGECLNLLIVAEEPALREQIQGCIGASSEALLRLGRVVVLDTLDEAFRCARPLAPREVLEVQRILNRQSRPPACELHDDFPPNSSGSIPISRRQSDVEPIEHADLSLGRREHR